MGSFSAKSASWRLLRKAAVTSISLRRLVELGHDHSTRNGRTLRGRVVAWFVKALPPSFASASASYASALQWHSYCIFNEFGMNQVMSNTINLGFLDQS